MQQLSAPFTELFTALNYMEEEKKDVKILAHTHTYKSLHNMRSQLCIER